MSKTILESIEESLMTLTSNKEALGKLLEQARVVESLKLQVAYEDGFLDGWSKGKYNTEPTYKDGEDYFNKNFKKTI